MLSPQVLFLLPKVYCDIFVQITIRWSRVRNNEFLYDKGKCSQLVCWVSFYKNKTSGGRGGAAIFILGIPSHNFLAAQPRDHDWSCGLWRGISRSGDRGRAGGRQLDAGIEHRDAGGAPEEGMAATRRTARQRLRLQSPADPGRSRSLT
jgi:hypothetical protein